MPLPVYRLRRLLAATAIVLTLAVAGMYFYARSRATDVLKSIPGKIAYDIKQTASGFQFSKSEGGRTQFIIRARDVKEFKLNGNAELHGVSIVLYGRDSTRFDQISGDDFSYNQKTGDVTAQGEVQIDLVANPAGLAGADQSAPKELKNPIHLKTRDLVFNKESGDASTEARVDFRTPQAAGWAVGVTYDGKTKLMTLMSQVHVTFDGPEPSTIEGDHGVITNDPHQILLEHPRLTRKDGVMDADLATFYLTADNHVQRIVATGNVTTESHASAAPAKDSRSSSEAAELHGRADQAEFVWAEGQDEDRQVLRTATFTGNVHFEQTGAQPMQGDAGRAIVDFAGKNEVQKVHAVDGARLYQKAESAERTSTGKSVTGGKAAGPQDFELTAPVIDFDVAGGRYLRRAQTSGAAQITISDAQPVPNPRTSQSAGQRTVVTAGKFTAEFTTSEGRTRMATMHGAPDARIVNSNLGMPDRVSTSESVDAAFLPQGGIESVTQTGHVVYTDNQPPEKRVQAWANAAHYTPGDQMLTMTGSPRITNGAMVTTANTVRINRATDDAFAEGDVKSTYSELKEQPDGALLASSSPIHVTARTMTAHNTPSLALYAGNARLWQDANVITAPSIEFDRDRRFVTAQGTLAQPVRTVLVRAEKPDAEERSAGKNRNQSTTKSLTPGDGPIAITAMKLTYADAQRKAHYDGGVVAQGTGFSATSNSADAYLLPHSQTAKDSGQDGLGQLDHIVATGNVVVQQPNRRGAGDNLVYTAADDKFVLTGGPPSIFDAEQGKITGVSLTFFRRDDRVLVEGEASTSVVTTTRMAR